MIRVFTDFSVKNRTNEIIKNELADTSKPVYFIVPEFSKAQIEGLIIRTLNEPQDIDISVEEVDEFIAKYDIDIDLDELEDTNYISNSIKSRNAIYSVLKNSGNKYKILGKFSDSSEVIGIISKYLDESNEEKLELLSKTDESLYAELIQIKTDVLSFSGIEIGSSFTNGDILSFRKLSSRILEMGGKNLAGSSDELLLRNAIYSILVSHEKEFNSFKKLVSKFDYINMIIRLLGDFARYNIGSEQIRKGIECAKKKEAPDQAYIEKLSDIALLMDYISEINSKYGFKLMSDPIGIANEMLKGVLSNGGKATSRLNRSLIKYLRSKFVFIGFGSTRNLTPKEMELVSLLSDLGADVHLYSLYAGEENEDETVYKAGKEFVSAMKSKGAVIIPMMPVSSSDSLHEIVEKYTHHIETKTDISNCVHLTEIKNTDDRIGYMFDEILRLTKEKNYRYRDIRIVCCDDSLIGRLRSVSAHYGLDVFVDQKIMLSNTPIPYITQIILDLPKTNYSLEMLLKAMRSGFLKTPQMYIADAFDNFCHKYNIVDIAHGIFDQDTYLAKHIDEKDGKEKYVKGDQIYIYDKSIVSFDNKDEYLAEQSMNAGVFFWYNLVNPILIPLRKVAEQINTETILSKKALYLMEYLNKSRVYTELLAEELSSLNKESEAVALIRGYDEMMSLLANFTHEMNDVVISQKAFVSLIRTDMRNKTQGSIPLNVDSVEITTPDRAFVAPCKVLFIIGAKKDNFPYKKSVEGLLSNLELKELKTDIDVYLPDKTELLSRQEFTTACLTLGTATDHIYMLHEFGEAKSRVYEFFESNMDKSTIGINNYEMPVNEEPVQQNYNHETAMIDPEIVDKLIGEGFTVSVSRLQDFNECHHKFMLDRILKIRPRDDNTEIKSNRFGSLMHKMLQDSISEKVSGLDTKEKLEEFYNTVVKNEAEMDKLADEYMLKSLLSKDDGIPGSVDSEGNIKPEFLNNPGKKLKRMFVTVFPGIIEDCIKDSFRPAEFESKIGPNDVYKKEFFVGNKKFGFTGSIDRLDLNYDDNNVFRIHDYKTGEKKLNASELIEGVQIQLPAYASAVLSNDKDRKLESFGYSLLGIKAENGKEFTLNINDSQKGVFSSENLEYVVKYADYIIQKDCEDIVAGNADARVYHKHACDFCNYRGLCGNSISEPVKRELMEKQFDEDPKVKALDEQIANATSDIEKMKNQRKMLIIKKHLGEDEE